MNQNDLQVVKTYSSRIEAEIGKSKLAANNINSVIIADDAGGMYPLPLSPNSKGVQLLVKKSDLKKASGLINS